VTLAQPSSGFALPPLVYTLCFLTRRDPADAGPADPGGVLRDGAFGRDDVLMLLRVRPPNRGLWNGVGGHIEPGENPHASVLREVQEETGYVLPAARFCGLLTWEGYEVPRGGLYIFTAPAPPGEPHPTPEGTLAWKPRRFVLTSDEVVSNIHRFGSPVLDGAAPQVYHFAYRRGQILRHEIYPLPPGFHV